MPPIYEVVIISGAVFGTSWVIADSKISFPARQLLASRLGPDSLLMAGLECPPCLSFWLGLVAGLAMHWGWFSIVLAPICTAVSLLCWTYVERG